MGAFEKLKARAGWPSHILRKINDNAYKINLSEDYNILATLNVTDLTQYYEGSDASTNVVEAPQTLGE